MSAIYIVLDRHVYNLYIDFYDLLATLVSNHATPHVTRYLTLFFLYVIDSNSHLYVKIFFIISETSFYIKIYFGFFISVIYYFLGI